MLDNLAKLTIPNSELTMHDEEIDFQENLEMFADSLTHDERKMIYKRKKKSHKNKKLKEIEEQRKNQIYQLIKNGDINAFISFVENYINTNCEKEDDAEIKLKFINQILDDHNNTLLHLASFYEFGSFVTYLLDNDANPCSKNTKQQTPYTITQNAEIREIFRKFASDHPEKYNYNKAQIPLCALTAVELAEKKKQQQKMKREREKMKKKENQKMAKEEMEKVKFLQLSDAEKVVV